MWGLKTSALSFRIVANPEVEKFGQEFCGAQNLHL